MIFHFILKFQISQPTQSKLNEIVLYSESGWFRSISRLIFKYLEKNSRNLSIITLLSLHIAQEYHLFFAKKYEVELKIQLSLLSSLFNKPQRNPGNDQWRIFETSMRTKIINFSLQITNSSFHSYLYSNTLFFHKIIIIRILLPSYFCSSSITFSPLDLIWLNLLLILCFILSPIPRHPKFENQPHSLQSLRSSSSLFTRDNSKRAILDPEKEKIWHHQLIFT